MNEKFDSSYALNNEISRKLTELKKLSHTLKKSQLIENCLRANGIRNIHWPIKLQFTLRPGDGYAYGSFTDRRGDVILRLSHPEISVELQPEQLKKDLKARAKKC